MGRHATNRAQVALVGALASGCLQVTPSASPPPDGRPNVLLISVDTLRADRLGAYGATRDTSPAFDGLAGTGALFTNVIAESSWTVPSHISLFSGRYPSTHGITSTAFRVNTGPWLSEALQQAGYATLANTDSGYLKRGQFGRGFDRFDDTDKSFHDAVGDTLGAIDAQPPGTPWFAFVHTYDVHCPYDPPAPYAGMFRSDGAEPIDTADRCGATYYNQVPLRPGQRAHVIDQYDAGVRWADAALGELIWGLETRGMLDHTVLIITSDHGEEFWEHGSVGHGRTLHDEVLRVPLLIVDPAQPATRVDTPVGLVDVLPTVLERVGLPPDDDAEGHSLMALIRGEDTAHPPGYRVSQLSKDVPATVRLSSVYQGDEHVIVDHRSGRAALFDRAVDPAERIDIAAQRPDRVADLRAALATIEERTERAGHADAPALDAARVKELEALGYISAP